MEKCNFYLTYFNTRTKPPPLFLSLLHIPRRLSSFSTFILAFGFSLYLPFVVDAIVKCFGTPNAVAIVEFQQVDTLTWIGMGADIDLVVAFAPIYWHNYRYRCFKGTCADADALRGQGIAIQG